MGVTENLVNSFYGNLLQTPYSCLFSEKTHKNPFPYNCKKGGGFEYLLNFVVEVMEHMMGYYSGLRL